MSTLQKVPRIILRPCDIPWGPTGQLVYERTYRRPRPDGHLETWPQTVERVVRGNLALVDSCHIEAGEEERLLGLITSFALLPAGRHLWMSGVEGREFLFNCHVAGWDSADPAAHYAFVFDQLMQGGGVGSNYSNRYVLSLPPIRSTTDVHIVCTPNHPDAPELVPFLSDSYDPAWPGSIRIEDSREGWVSALRRLLDAAWAPTCPTLVFDVGLVRPRGAPIRTFGGVAGGPALLGSLLNEVSKLLNNRVGSRLSSLDAMVIDHLIAGTVVAGGVRRSARMSIKSWSDPDIAEFLLAKSDDGNHWTTNLSVEIDNNFVGHLADAQSPARAMFERVITGMLDNGEPGFWNRELSSIGERGQVVATNPCGEVALEAWENCNLGHVNLAAFPDDHSAALEAHRLAARFLLRATFGDVSDDRQREALDRNRRIGVGHMGFQEWIVAQGVRYSDSHRDGLVADALRRLRHEVRVAADSYATELGIASPVKVTVVAPTGTVAKLPGVSEGIQPIYSRYFLRRVRVAEHDPVLATMAHHGYYIENDLYAERTKVVSIPTKDLLFQRAEDRWGSAEAERLVESADEIELSDFLAVQAMYQECYADNAVSATANLPAGMYSPDEVSAVLRGLLPRLKGTTLMIDDARPQAPYERMTRAEYEQSASPELGQTPSQCSGDRCPIGE